MATVKPVDGSSSRIVPVADAVPIVAWVGEESFTTNVSFASSIVSPTIGTSIVAVVVPATIVAVPDTDV